MLSLSKEKKCDSFNILNLIHECNSACLVKTSCSKEEEKNLQKLQPSEQEIFGSQPKPKKKKKKKCIKDDCSHTHTHTQKKPSRRRTIILFEKFVIPVDMEYNEPLNLSVKKKPIAVVIPSSSTSNNKVDGTGSSVSISNDADDPNERLDTLSSPSGGIHDNDNLNRSTPLPHLDETNICHNATIDMVSVCSSLCSNYILRLTKRMFHLQTTKQFKHFKPTPPPPPPSYSNCIAFDLFGFLRKRGFISLHQSIVFFLSRIDCIVELTS